MYVVGLTGGIGSGKSSVANLFAERGITVVDADAISHQLTAAGGGAIAKLRAAFGDEMIDAQGALDRARMRDLVYRDPDAKRRLEAVLHPLIRDEAARQIAAAQSPYVIHMIPLLVEAGNARERFDRVLVVDCPEETQIARVSERDGMLREQIEAIMKTQASRAARLAQADDIVDNSSSPAGLPPQVQQLHRLYLRLAAQK